MKTKTFEGRQLPDGDREEASESDFELAALQDVGDEFLSEEELRYYRSLESHDREPQVTRTGGTSVQLTIDTMNTNDWPAVKAIYQQGIATGHATFETQAPEWEEWDAEHLADCRLVARDDDGEVLGWAALSPVSGRCVYAGVAEVSVYVAESAQGQGVGKALLIALVQASEQAGIWTLEAGIFPENVASIALHEKCGFRIVGTRERLGKMNGAWRDVVMMERRSAVVGVDRPHALSANP